jgi:hypothetical protein
VSAPQQNHATADEIGGGERPGYATHAEQVEAILDHMRVRDRKVGEALVTIAENIAGTPGAMTSQLVPAVATVMVFVSEEAFKAGKEAP